MSLKTYQWIKGEKAGNVIKGDGKILFEDGMNWLVFQDGSMCNADLVGDFIIELAGDSQDDLILLNEVAPTPMKKVEAPITKTVLLNEFAPKPETKVESTSLSPVDSLLLGAKKKREKVAILVEVEVPSADLLKVVADSFDDGEKHIANYLKSSLDIEKIKQQITSHIMASVFAKEPKTTRKKNEKV